jgi:hypothetical protein
MDRNRKGDFFMFEDDHVFSVEAYDHVTGQWFGMGFYESRSGVEAGISLLRENWKKEQSPDSEYELLVRIVETRTEYV